MRLTPAQFQEVLTCLEETLAFSGETWITLKQLRALPQSEVERLYDEAFDHDGGIAGFIEADSRS